MTSHFVVTQVLVNKHFKYLQLEKLTAFTSQSHISHLVLMFRSRWGLKTHHGNITMKEHERGPPSLVSPLPFLITNTRASLTASCVIYSAITLVFEEQLTGRGNNRPPARFPSPSGDSKHRRSLDGAVLPFNCTATRHAAGATSNTHPAPFMDWQLLDPRAAVCAFRVHMTAGGQHRRSQNSHASSLWWDSFMFTGGGHCNTGQHRINLLPAHH